MTNQTLVQTVVSDRTGEMSSSNLAGSSPQLPAGSVATTYQARMLEAMKSQYQLDQQVKFLHLQAEAESLLQQLQSIKQQRQAAGASRAQSR